MSEEINAIFEKYSDVFIEKVDEIKEYTIKYLKKLFQRQDLINVQRIDATDRISKSGFQKQVSSWRNTYQNVIISTGVVVEGQKKRYDYKFIFTEERLGDEIVEEIENAIKESSVLKKKFQFQEGLSKIEDLIEKIRDKNDKYYNKRLNDLKKEILDSEKEYKDNCAKLEQLQATFTDNKTKNELEAALKDSNEIIRISKLVGENDITKEFSQTSEELEVAIKEKKEREQEVSQLEKKVANNRKREEFEEAIENCELILGLAVLLKNDDLKQKYESLKSEINQELDEKRAFEEQLNQLTNEIENDRKSENYEEDITKCEKAIELSNSKNKSEFKEKYTRLQEDIKKDIELKKELEEKQNIEEQIQVLEQKLKVERENKKYEDALSKSNKILDLAKNLEKNELIETYTKVSEELQSKIEENIALETQIYNLEKEINILSEAGSHDEALTKCNDALNLCQKLERKDLEEKFNTLIREINSEKERKLLMGQKEEVKKKIEQLEILVKEQQENGQEEDALKTCKEIINLANKIEEKEVEEKYIQISDAIQMKLDAKAATLAEIESLKSKISEERAEKQYENALEDCTKLINLAQKLDDGELKENYIQISEDIKKEKQKIQERESLLEEISQLENKLKNERNNNHLQEALTTSNLIIEKSKSIENKELEEKYIRISKEIQEELQQKQSSEEEKALKAQKAQETKETFENNLKSKQAEQEELLQTAKKLEETMYFAENSVPIIEKFSINEILGDISADIDAAMEQVSGLLDEHRVKIKNEINNTALITTASGEISELENTIKVQEQKNDKDQVSYQVQSGLTNPFNDIIEEAIITDLIPYNFEINTIEVNGKTVDQLPDKVLIKEGIELQWKFNNIQPKEKVDINYNLRRRISRTAIFTFESDLKIIKAHYDISDVNRPEGLHEAILPFSNNYGLSVNALVIEDIIPLYYINFIKEPTKSLPLKSMSADHGQLVKWKVGTMEPGSINYYYKLLELFLFEQLKIEIDSLDKEGYKALEQEDIDGTLNKYQEIMQKLNDFIK